MTLLLTPEGGLVMDSLFTSNLLHPGILLGLLASLFTAVTAAVRV
jgi:hypothetical protein